MSQSLLKAPSATGEMNLGVIKGMASKKGQKGLNQAVLRDVFR
jgi:hypothetical protein